MDLVKLQQTAAMTGEHRNGRKSSASIAIDNGRIQNRDG
jgi:hypothetical protein